jgi:hypothetical protein
LFQRLERINTHSPMNKRPLSVTVVGWLFIVTGVVGLVYHAGEIKTLRPLEYALVCLVRLLAIFGGAFLLRGRNRARWLVVAWLAFHVALSVLHTPAELAMHAALLVLIAWLLFRPKSSAWFKPAPSQASPVAPAP